MVSRAGADVGEVDPRVVGALRRVPGIAGASVVVLGVLVLVGWLLGIPFITNLHPSLAPMKANTALSLVALGLALRMRRKTYGGAERVAAGLSVFVVLLGAATLLEYALGIAFGIDDLFFAHDHWSSVAPGRMSMITSSHFVLLGVATFAADRRVNARLTQSLALIVGLSSLLVLLGYAYGVRSLYAVRPYNTVALHTTLAFIALSLGLLCLRPDAGCMATVTAKGPGGELTRRLLPAVVFLPMALGWLRVQGQNLGLFGTSFGVALLVSSNVACLAALVFWAARALERGHTGERAAERKLRESEEDLAITIQSIGDAVIATDTQGRVKRMNKVAEELTGWSFAEAKTRALGEVFRIQSEDTREPAGNPVERVLRAGVVTGLANHSVLVARDGSERSIMDSGAPIRDGAGSIRGVVLVFHDQTAERNAKRALERSEARFRRMTEADVIGIVVSDTQGNVSEANDAFLAMVGYSRADVAAGRVNGQLLNTPERERTDANARGELRAFGRAKPWEKELLRKDGTRVPILIGVVIVEGAEQENIAFTLDLSERKRIEAALLASEARFRHLADSGILGIIVADGDGRVDEANDAFLRSVGYARIDLGAGRLRLGELTPEEWRTADRRAREELERTGAAQAWEKEYLRKDGTRVAVVVGMAQLDAARTIAFVLDRSEQKRAEEARVLALAVARKETQSRERAERALVDAEEQLRQSQKMEAVGTLAGGVAHDFNNILSIVLGFSELLIAEFEPEDPIRKDLEQIAHAGRRASALTRQLLAFSRRQVLQPKLVNLNEVVGGMMKMLERLIGEDTEFVFLPGADLRPTLVDPGQMEQVLMNLVVNARDAMPQGGKLTIETQNVELDATYCDEHLGVEAGKHVNVSVSDTGSGMDRATQARIFEPFFTTKEQGKGTGLGLSTVHGIIKQSGGHIWLDSEIGRGSTFKLYLPSTRDGAESERNTPDPTLERGSETLLLVEDDPQVRSLAVTILRRHGYRVLEAASGADAVITCERHEGTIHLLLTDVVMPRMSGRELWQQLAPRRPGMKVLFMSGYADDAIVRHGVLGSEFAFVQKPLGRASLLAKVRSVLDGASFG